jgi:hypothetical protein
MPKLYSKCKTCFSEFPSGISADKGSLATLSLSGNTHVCPKGHAHGNDQQDYYLKE